MNPILAWQLARIHSSMEDIEEKFIEFKAEQNPMKMYFSLKDLEDILKEHSRKVDEIKNLIQLAGRNDLIDRYKSLLNNIKSYLSNENVFEQKYNEIMNIKKKYDEIDKELEKLIKKDVRRQTTEEEKNKILELKYQKKKLKSILDSYNVRKDYADTVAILTPCIFGAYFGPLGIVAGLIVGFIARYVFKKCGEVNEKLKEKYKKVKERVKGYIENILSSL